MEGTNQRCNNCMLRFYGWWQCPTYGGRNELRPYMLLAVLRYLRLPQDQACRTNSSRVLYFQLGNVATVEKTYKPFQLLDLYQTRSNFLFRKRLYVVRRVAVSIHTN